MSLFKNIGGYDKVSLYDKSKTRKDIKYNIGLDSKVVGILSRSVSPFILRSETMRNFVKFLDDYLYNLLTGVKYLKNYKNFTSKKDDKYVR